MKPIDERLLLVSPLLRKKCREVELLARDLKIKLLLEALLWEGEYYLTAVDSICRRFGVSRTTVKRAARRFPTERPGGRGGIRRGLRSARLVHRGPVEPGPLVKAKVDADDRVERRPRR